MEAWEPAEGLRLIKERGCTTAVTATPFLQMLMGVYEPVKHAGSLKRWVCAGSPIPRCRGREVQRALCRL